MDRFSTVSAALLLSTISCGIMGMGVGCGSGNTEETSGSSKKLTSLDMVTGFTKLKLQRTDLTNAQLAAIVCLNPNLCRINIMGCKNLEPRILNELRNLPLIKLKLSGNVLEAVATSTPRVKKLKIADCTTLDPRSCSESLRKLTNLTLLGLSGPAITKQVVEAIATSTPKLTKLTLKNCPNLKVASDLASLKGHGSLAKLKLSTEFASSEAKIAAIMSTVGGIRYVIKDNRTQTAKQVIIIIKEKEEKQK